MKIRTLTHNIILFSIIFATSCKIENPNPLVTHPYGDGKGKEAVWSSAENVAYPIVITFKKDGNIRKVDSIRVPGNKNFKCEDTSYEWINFIDEAGPYTYSGKANSGQTWEGGFTIFANYCHTAELQGDSSCMYDLAPGNWVRQNDGGQPNSKGMILNFDGSNATVIYAPANCCFTPGNMVWNFYSKSDCSMNYFSTDANCQNIHNNKTHISFKSATDIITENAAEYKHQ